MQKMLTQDSVEVLRAEARKDYTLIFTQFDELVERHQLKLIDCPHDLTGIEFVMPTGIYQDTNGDNENCTLVYEKLDNLTAAQATDERFWVTAGFTVGKEYAMARWKFGEEVDEEEGLEEQAASSNKKIVQQNTSNLINHWFCVNARNRMRDHAISRLWWMGYIARRVDPKNPEAIYQSLFFNSAFRSDLLERNTSANAVNVVIAVLKISQEYAKQGMPYERDKFRGFMKQVDFIGKRTSLPSMDEEQLIEILEPVYKKQYSTMASTKSLLSRILGR